MLTKTEQEKVLTLVKQTKELIFSEMKSEEITVKGAADYVTNVDFAVQDFLKTELGRLFPQIQMVAEEKENKNLNLRGNYWILDPIDGTTNLIRNYGMSAVSLGLYENGEITFGAVYNPFHEELFYGAAGCGAWRNKKPIHTADITDLKEAVISFGSSPYEKERAKELFPLFEKIFTNCADFRRSGSAALDMCYVACGRLHGYIERNLKPWDYAAGTVILKEAGGIVEGWEKEALPYLFNADVLCSVPGIRDSLKSFL